MGQLRPLQVLEISAWHGWGALLATSSCTDSPPHPQDGSFTPTTSGPLKSFYLLANYLLLLLLTITVILHCWDNQCGFCLMGTKGKLHLSTSYPEKGTALRLQHRKSCFSPHVAIRVSPVQPCFIWTMDETSLIPKVKVQSVSHSQPCGLWTARLLYPRDSPGKNTGVG